MFAGAMMLYAGSSLTAVLIYNPQGSVLYRFVPGDSNRFTLRFLHSWARSPVDEIFEVASADVIYLVETLYEDFGAGLPHEPEPGRPKDSMKVEDGKIHITQINRRIPDLQVRIGRFVANHELLYGNKKIPLAEIASPGEALVFRAERIRRYELWKLREEGR